MDNLHALGQSISPMKLVAFRDHAWARLLGGLIDGEKHYVFDIGEALSFASRRKPRLIFYSTYLGDADLIPLFLQRSPDSLVVLITRWPTTRQRYDALALGAYEVVDVAAEDFPAKILQVVEVVREVRGSSSPSVPMIRPELRLVR